MKPTLLLQTLGIVVAVVMSGCGGGEEATPTPRPTLAPATSTPAVVATSAPRPTPTAIVSAATPAPTPTARPQATPTAAAPLTAEKLAVAVPSFANEVLWPSLGKSAGVGVFGGPIYDWLTWLTPDGALAPGVLRKWDMSRDGMSWTLAVRDDIKWHNGDALTASDVKFTYDQVLAVATNPNRGSFVPTWTASVASADVLSPTSVRVNLKLPWITMPYDIGARALVEGMVLPKAYVDRVGQREFEEKPIGTGPWKLVRHDLATRFVYEPSGLKHPYRETPRFKRMEILAIPEESTRLAMLKTGAADIIEIGEFTTAVALQKSGGLLSLPIPNAITGTIVIYGIDDPRITTMPLGKKVVRQALEMAINKKEILDTLFAGLPQLLLRFGMGPGTLGYDPNFAVREYNPTRAKELIAQAGYPTGFSFSVSNYREAGVAFLFQQTEAIVGYWSTIGLRPEMKIVERDTVRRWTRARPQAIDAVGTASPLYSPPGFSPLPVFRAVYHSSGSTLLLNRPDMDALIDRASSALDVGAQAALNRQIADATYEEAAAIPVGLMPALFGGGPRIAGWKALGGGLVGSFLETVIPK